MKLSSKAENIYKRIDSKTKLGDLRTIAKEIKKDHELAMELWATGEYLPRQLAILIMDGKLLTQEVIDELGQDMEQHPAEERNQLIDWLMANQLAKNKKNHSADGIVGGYSVCIAEKNFLVLPGRFAVDGTGTSA